MAEFKNSKLIERLEENNMLTDDAWSFVDACMDDYCVDESDGGIGTFYELRCVAQAFYHGEEFPVTEIYYGTIDGMAALIEHLALVNTLLLQHEGIGADYIEKENRE